MGNAKASNRGTGDRYRFPRFSFIYVIILFLTARFGNLLALIRLVMSQNKTVVPGMESSEGTYARESDFYARNTNNRTYGKGTVVPGMEAGEKQSFNTPKDYSAREMSNKPVAGFLYSISRRGIGEYWPIYLGQNTIGSSRNCDICLREATISHEHAVLVVRKMKNPEKTIASISDAHSTNGTMVNGVSLDFSAMECFSGDIITVGENYELVLLLIDVKALGLKVSENFMPLYSEESSVIEEEMPYSPSRPQYDNPPSFASTHSNSYTSSYAQSNYSDGTIGMDGGGNVSRGGTQGI